MEKKDDDLKSKSRFSSRVGNYIKYRPTYPLEIINFLKNEQILQGNTIIADIGSGTGKLTELFLKQGNLVHAVEPNNEMRSAAEQLFKGFSNFMSINGSAEKTVLEENSMDLIVVGQAFHWFKVEETRIEFKRILRENGHVAIIWNSRKKNETEFLKDYENLLQDFGTDYEKIKKLKPNMHFFFSRKEIGGNFQKKIFQNHQDLNFTSLKGRFLSTSYTPLPDHPNFNKMIAELERIFQKHKKEGKVRIEYDTELFYGKIT